MASQFPTSLNKWVCPPSNSLERRCWDSGIGGRALRNNACEERRKWGGRAPRPCWDNPDSGAAEEDQMWFQMDARWMHPSRCTSHASMPAVHREAQNLGQGRQLSSTKGKAPWGWATQPCSLSHEHSGCWEKEDLDGLPCTHYRGQKWPCKLYFL